MPSAADDVPTAPATVRIALADDHEVVRSGLRLVLEGEPDMEIVAEAADVESATRMVLGHKPDVLVLDLNMPGGSSLPAIPQMIAASPGTAVVVLTMQEDPAFAREALRAGALGYVLKEAASTELVQAIRLALTGGTYLHPSLGAKIAAAPERSGPPDDLSAREVEVLRLIALGHTNTEIGGQLFLSVRTVESHRAHIQQKLRRTTRAELVAYALEHDLIGSGRSAGA
jgi:two-component system response regulator NreC